MRIVGSNFTYLKNQDNLRAIYLYQIQVDPAGNTYLRYTSWPGGVTVDGYEYKHFPCAHDNVDENISGEIGRVTMKLSNVSRELQALLDDNEGLQEREVIIIQTFEECLADPTARRTDRFYIAQTMVTEKEISFSLSSKLDVLDIRLPRRTVAEAIKRVDETTRLGGYSVTPASQYQQGS